MSWKAESLKASKIDEMIRNREITTPTYQRGAKWTENQQSNLIDSIKKGFPFGSILLDKKDNGSGKITYDLIDGLQRCTTINKFLNQPGQYFKKDDIEDTFLTQIFRLLSDNDKGTDKVATTSAIRSEIVNYVETKLPTMEKVKGIQYYDVSVTLAKKWPSLFASITQLNQIIENLFSKFKKTCTDLTDTEIPAIIYDGDQSLLPEVFERINSKGTTLSKYDIFAASWRTTEFSVTDSDFASLFDFVCKRYEEMNDSDIAVTDFDAHEYKRKASLDTFNLCYSFGKLVEQKYPTLFGEKSKSIEVDSVGFNLINACIGKPVSALSSLDKNLSPFKEKIQSLLRKILDSCSVVYGYLKVITTFKGNSTNGMPILHSENQIISIVASVFLAKYAAVEKDDDDKIASITLRDAENVDWQNKETKFEKNIPIVYVEDSLSNAWNGTGDKHLYNVICDLGYYLRDFSKEEFDGFYRNWFVSIRKQRNEEKCVKSPTSTDKIILNIYTSQTVKAADAYSNKSWDIEHICPKKLMKDNLERLNRPRDEESKIKLPLSSIGNICYLPTALNRSKEERTIYQANLSEEDLKEIEDKFSLTSKADLDWLSDQSLSADDFKEKYLSFVEKRSKTILGHIDDFLF